MWSLVLLPGSAWDHVGVHGRGVFNHCDTLVHGSVLVVSTAAVLLAAVLWQRLVFVAVTFRRFWQTSVCGRRL